MFFCLGLLHRIDLTVETYSDEASKIMYLVVRSCFSSFCAAIPNLLFFINQRIQVWNANYPAPYALFLTRAILKGMNLRKFVFDDCVCMFCFMFVYRLSL